jgi:DNA-binding response OmpR family regulator
MSQEAFVARLLVVEDECKVLRSLDRGLRAEGYEVVTAATGEDGYRLAVRQSFDCVVLDLMLPGRDGLQILSDLRRAGKKLPVLVLTARDAVEDRVIGLDAGADDYMIKPFAFAELLARLRTLLRRERADRETTLRTGDLEMDLIERRVTRGRADISLTQREFEVLAYLVRHKNAVVTRDMLGREIWKEPFIALTNVVEVYVNALRRKLEKAGGGSLIHTIRGVGYSLRDEP